MVSEKTLASLLVMMLGKTAPGHHPPKPRAPEPEPPARTEVLSTYRDRLDDATDFGNLRGPAALAASRRVRGLDTTQRSDGKPSDAVAARDARLQELYRRNEANRPRND